MIKHLRIDNRLIHGQVAVTWMRLINADAIVVVNDAVARIAFNRWRFHLPLETPRSLCCRIKPCKITSGASSGRSLVQVPTDALQILESGLDVGEVNVGMLLRLPGPSIMVEKKSIAAAKEDAEVYRKIAALRGGKLLTQTVSTYEPQDFLELLRKAGL